MTKNVMWCNSHVKYNIPLYHIDIFDSYIIQMNFTTDIKIMLIEEVYSSQCLSKLHECTLEY